MPRTPSHKLLVIDDDAAVRNSLVDYLEDQGFTVFSAPDGKRGIALALAELPDLAVVDLRMPEVDGFDVITTLHSSLPELPLIVISGTVDTNDLMRALHAGAWDILLKPISSLQLLLHRINFALERVRLQRESLQHNEELEAAVATRTRELEETLQALRVSERDLDSILKGVQDIIYRVTLDGVFTFVSDAVRRYGVIPEDMIGSSVLQWVVQEDHAKAISLLQSRLSGDTTLRSAELRVQTPSGAKIPFELTSIMLPDAGPGGSIPMIQGILRDISARKQAEQEAIRFKTVVDDSHVAIVLTDPAGRVLYTNPTFGRLFDCPQGEGGDDRLLAYLDPQGRDDLLAALPSIQSGNDWESTIQATTAGGETLSIHIRMNRILDVYGQPMCFFGLIQDVTRQIQDQRMIRENEARMRLLFEQLPAILWTTDRDLHFTSGIGAPLEALHMAPEHFDAAFLHRHMHSGPDHPMAMHSRALAGDSVTYEHEWAGRLYRAHVEALRENTGQTIGCIGVALDISDLKRTEETLREQELMYRELVQNASSIILRLDPSWSITFYNEFAESFFGYPREGILGGALFDSGVISTEESEARFRRLVEEGSSALAGSVVIESEGRKASGATVWIAWSLKSMQDAHGVLTGFLMVGNDMTLLRQAEHERAWLAILIEQIAEAVMVTDVDSHIQYVNPAFTVLTGYTLREAVGHNPSFLKSGRHDRSFYAVLWDTIKSGGTWRGHLVDRAKDNELIELETTISPVHDADGGIIGFISISRNITRERTLEAMLHHAQRMESLGVLASGIAHDFNNILGVIIGFAELALMQSPEVSPARGSLAELMRAGQRARDLVRRILTFSRDTGQEVRPLLCQDIVSETVAFLRSAAPAGIAIHAHIVPDTPPVQADPSQLHQVVMNLCTNAIHAMRGQSGELIVSLKGVKVTDPIQAYGNTLMAGTYVVLTIQDTGYGISPAVLEHIFEPYYSTKPQGEGTGLGLSTVLGVVTSLQGGITVTSESGEGASFAIYLPALSGAVTHTPTHAMSISDRYGSGERILYLDDEERMASVAHLALEKLGFRVMSFTSPHDALAAFTAQPDAFDVIVTDQSMPGMTGLEVCHAARDIRPDLPVILCTGFLDAELETAGKEAGVYRVLQKPLTIRELAETIHLAIEGRSGPNAGIQTPPGAVL